MKKYISYVMNIIKYFLNIDFRPSVLVNVAFFANYIILMFYFILSTIMIQNETIRIKYIQLFQ